MKQAIDHHTAELPGLSPDETGNRGRAARTRGAYLGAAKTPAQALRARTGLSQADFARRAGVSERSLRTWEASFTPVTEVPKAHAAIVAALAALGLSYTRPAARVVRYRCPRTGSTWSGRGLKPRWLVVALDGGARLADFEVRA